MRHFIAYHNTEKMGRPLHDGDPLALATNKAVNHLLHNIVWFITGEGVGPRRYALGSVFCVAKVGETTAGDFKRFASGPGHVFQSPVPVNEMEWFPEILRITGNFGLGVQEVKGETVIAGLLRIAAQAGHQVA